MDIKSALFYVEVVVGFFLFIVVSYFLLKVLGIILMVVLAGIGFVAKVIFKILYVLFMIALAACGAGYAMYTGLLFLNHEPIHILWTLSGIFVMLLGMNGLVNFAKTGFRFPSEIRSSHPQSNSSSDFTFSTNNNRPYYHDPDEEPSWPRRMFEDKRQAEIEAKENAWQAIQDTWREERNQAIEDQKIASWNADQEKWAEFDRKRAEEDEYNRQEREKWSQQD